MINAIVSYDDQDFKLGTYFEKSYNTFRERVGNVAINFTSLDGENCTTTLISSSVEKFNTESFVFVGFSHGSDSDLHTSSDNYVCLENCALFDKSFFYATACSCSYELGPALIDNGCFSFIGYDDEVKIHTDYHEIFIDCEIHAIVEFFNTKKSIGEVFDEMLSKYDEVIERLWEGTIDDTIVASTLLRNQRLLRILGNENLTSSDFYIEGKV